MSELLQLVRDVNPVDRSTLEVPPSVYRHALEAAARGRAPSRRRRHVLTAVAASVAVAAAALLIGLGDGNSSLGLAGRAYAATAGPGVVHWQIAIDTYVDGELGTQQTEEGWAGDGITHVFETTSQDGRTRVTERRLHGNLEVHRVDNGPYEEGSAPRTDLQVVLPGDDPFAAFRDAYRSGRLQQISQNRFRVHVPSTVGKRQVELQYEVDPETATPRTLTESVTVPDASGSVRHEQFVIRFGLYEQMPATDAASKLDLTHTP
jgi:hypothetical protein